MTWRGWWSLIAVVVLTLAALVVASNYSTRQCTERGGHETAAGRCVTP